MRIGKKEIPKERIKTVATICDLCGEDVDDVKRETETGGGVFDGTEVEIEAKVGRIYPNGDGDRKVFEIDCCIVCFMEKVKPAIEALGCQFRQRDIDRHRNLDAEYYQKIHALDCDMGAGCACEKRPKA